MSAPSFYQILYFGLLAERSGRSEESFASTAATPAALYRELNAIYQFGMAPRHLRVAVNAEFVSWDHPLAAGDTVALLPPMSGG